jgi:hypothetical protein
LPFVSFYVIYQTQAPWQLPVPTTLQVTHLGTTLLTQVSRRVKPVNRLVVKTAPGAGAPQQQQQQLIPQGQQQVQFVKQGVQQPPVVDPFDACLQHLSLSPAVIQHTHYQGFEHEEDLLNMTSFEGR